MKNLRIVSVFCLAFLAAGLFAQPALTAPGDVNGNGIAGEIADLVYLMNYLFDNGSPPPNPIDADIDGTAGINVGDVLRFSGYFVYGVPECGFQPYTGVGPSFSEIEFAFPVITSGGTEPFDVTVDLIDNPGPDLVGIVIVFSYQHQAGHVGVDLDTVDFAGSIVPAEWEAGAYVDNLNKRALLMLAAPGDYLPLGSGITGPVATLTFTRTEDPSGEATYLSPTVYPPTHSSVLITTYCAKAPAPSDRMLYPKLVFGKNGDVNCNGVINEGDVIFLLNYLYLGTSPPCVW
jgi:hypothetical protein